MTLSASRVATAAGLLVVLATWVAVAVPSAGAATDTVLSLNKPATASSNESAGLPPGNAVDGNTGTRWASAFGATAWFQVDLGSDRTVNRVAITWENAYAKAFTVSLSTNGTTWTTAYQTTTGTGGQQSLAVAGTARYVKLDLTTRALPAYGYSMWEFQVYGPAAPSTATAVNNVAVVNDATHRPILGLSPLVEGDVIDLTRLANRNLSLQATLAAGTSAGSVAFTLTGAKGTSYARTENTAPYFLCNDYVDCPLLAAADTYTLTVQPYAAANAAGSTIGAPLTLHFTVSATAVTQPALSVLFVGNSLIGTPTTATGEDTPAVVRHLATSAGRALTVTEVIHFGNTLQQTWNGGEVATALSGTTKYDYIVLQEYSTLVATSPSAARSALLDTYAPALNRSLKPSGKVVLFKNWALVDPSPFPSRAANVTAIDTNYAALSTSFATPNLLAPISETFETEIAAHGTSYLIVADGKHPNDAAIYMDAVTLYGILFRSTPRAAANLFAAATTATELKNTAAAAIGY
ncbi:discoidin domain-containing protein [Dactylosporangium sp. CS-047395]|uniref:discoidin domain-containing protein n=1 Tax=Dactylosporangium sp. CS-047395 TaxID=3239936 RepID=UPI003D926251